MNPSTSSFRSKILNLLSQTNYPCVAALKSFHSDDYKVGFYDDFGSTGSSLRLATDLIQYAQEYKKTKSPFFTFWAVFPHEKDLTDEEFENKLWRELSGLASITEFDQTWDPHFSSNPEDKNFCFSLGGDAFFVVGLHSQSARLARRFEHPTLIFNLYEQFRQLEINDQFQPMIELNRKRDIKFQGSANPMAITHGNEWESIQFSGRQNSNEWKCPFHRIMNICKI